MPNQNVTVQGTDGHYPFYDPTDKWHQWSTNEIYMGTQGANKFVPKVNDFVIDTETFTTYKVISLNASFIPTLLEIQPPYMNGFIPSSDVVFGSLAGLDGVGYLVYLDKTTMPYTLNVDTHLLVTHPDAAYAKVFLGTDITATGEVISRIYDGSNNFVSNNVPLSSIAVNNYSNIAVKTLSTCKTVKNMSDREMVTVVIYTNSGIVVDKKICFVENTGFIRDLNSTQRMISHIELITGLMSPTSTFQVDAPIGMSLSPSNFECKVWYTDGSATTLPVDGTKVALYGLSEYSATAEGHTTGLTLRYKLAANEQTSMVTGGVGVNRSISKHYRIKVVSNRPSYTVKLFAFPEWDTTNLRYTLRWFLTSLDRSLWRDVTSNVAIVTPLGGFDGVLFNAAQNLSVQLNLHDVSAVYDPIVITQNTVVTVRDISNAIPWVVKHKNIPGQPDQSGNIRAVRVTAGSINLGSGSANLNDWLTRFFTNSGPILNTAMELEVPTPTHMRIYKRNGNTISPITSHLSTANWNANISVSLGVGETIDLLKSLTVVFYSETGMSTYIELGLAHVLIKAS